MGILANFKAPVHNSTKEKGGSTGRREPPFSPHQRAVSLSESPRLAVSSRAVRSYPRQLVISDR